MPSLNLIFASEPLCLFPSTDLTSDLMKVGTVVKAGHCCPLHDLLKKRGHSLWCSFKGLSKIHLDQELGAYRRIQMGFESLCEKNLKLFSQYSPGIQHFLWVCLKCWRDGCSQRKQLQLLSFKLLLPSPSSLKSPPDDETCGFSIFQQESFTLSPAVETTGDVGWLTGTSFLVKWGFPG